MVVADIFKSIPYVAVLRGEVAPETFRDKYVLIGATAQGNGRCFSDACHLKSRRALRVEINANILMSLIDQRSIIEVSH